MSSLSASEHFETYALRLSPMLWRASARTRGRLFHGTGRCPQSVHPFAAKVRDVLCPDCTEYHHRVLIAADRRVSTWLRNGRDSGLEAIEAHIQSLRESILLDARDAHDADRGLATRLSRIPRRSAWFVEAVPDELDRELVIDVLYFARGGDRADRGLLPISNLAERHGVDSHECTVRVARALAGLRARKPKWIEANFDRPMSARLAEGGAADFDEVVAAVRQEVA